MPRFIEIFPMEKVSAPAPKGVGFGGIKVDLDLVSDSAREQVAYQGLKYLYDAECSHEFTRKNAEAKAAGVPKAEWVPLTLEEATAAVDKITAKLYAPEWVRRTATERAPVDPEGAAWHSVLTDRFTKAGALKRKSKTQPEPVTVESLVAKHGGREQAYTAVAVEFLKGRGMDEEKARTNAAAGWAKVQKEVAAKIKAAGEDTL